MAHNRHFGSKYSHFGENGKGHDVKAYGNTTGKYFEWDASANKLTVSGEVAATGGIAGALTGSTVIEKADSYALSAADKANTFISLKATAGSKTFTLGLAEGQVAFVYNHGTETFTLKNVADDTGTAVATTELVFVVGSATANGSTVVTLNPSS